jgi:hypothetical protein
MIAALAEGQDHGQEPPRGSDDGKGLWMTCAVTSRRDGVGPRAAAWLAWGAAALTVVFTGLHLVLWTWPSRSPGAVDTRGQAAISIPFAVMGALIVARRRGNRVGWLFVAIGFLGALQGALAAYALYTLAARPGTDLPGAVVAASGSLAIGESRSPWCCCLCRCCIPPAGCLRRGGGRSPGSAGWCCCSPPSSTPSSPAKCRPAGSPWGENPLGIAAAEGPLSLLLGAMLFLLIPLALAAQVVRFRRARGDERQQLKWLAYAILSFLAYLLLLPAFSLLVFWSWPQ